MCCARTRKGHLPCSRPATVEEDGSPYCKQHAPSTVRARRAESEAKWRRNLEISQLQHDRRRPYAIAFNAIAYGLELAPEAIAQIQKCAAELEDL